MEENNAGPNLEYTLHSAFLEVTPECNSLCVYCRNPESDASHILTYREIERIIGELSEIGVKELVITGGEPLLREDLPDIIHVASKYGLETLLATNGRLLSDGFLQEIKSDKIKIQVSLDSIYENINDRLRGNGSYTGAMNAINLCLEHEVPLQISTTITDLNYGDIPAVIDYSASKNTPVKLRRFVEKGKGGNRHDLAVSDDKLEMLLEKYVLNPKYNDMVSAEQMPYCNGRNIYRCSAANSIIFIRSDGQLGPCPSSSETYGNMKEKSIKEILENDSKSNRGTNYRPEGICGRNYMLLKEKTGGQPVVSGAMSYNDFMNFGCKCTG